MYDISQAQESFKATSQWLINEYSTIHTGQASPGILDGVKVEVYGAFQPVKNLASIIIEGPKSLLVSPWDKNVIKPIEKAITEADLGLSLATDSSGIRVHFPQLTEETRMKVVKILKSKLEEARVAIRRERENAIKDIDGGDSSDDDKKRSKENLQKLVDEANQSLEEIFKQKEEVTMKV